MKTESLPEGERQSLLDEVRSYLPAFLSRATTVQQDPAGDVRELLDLDQRDLDRVVAVHLCLSPAVLAFGEALENGLRQPLTGGRGSTVISQSVRGRLVWQETFKHRARAPGETASFAVLEPGKAFDTPEGRALTWLLDRLLKAVDEATTWRAEKPPEGEEELSWWQQIDRLGRQLAAARATPWLQAAPPQKPTAAVLRGLESTRSDFYGRRAPAAAKAALHLSDPSPETLTAILSERYFRPKDDGTLFEVAVALRLARAFDELSPDPRQARLLMGEGRSSFASYTFADGSEVSLAYQAWPDDKPSMRRRFIRRHRIGARASNARPDIIIVRTGASPDAVILELKATQESSYLRKGLEELLSYLADRPDLWGDEPAAWLVAPPSSAFEGKEVDTGFPLWVLGADEVAVAATERFVASGLPPQPGG